MRLLPREEKFFDLFDELAACLVQGAGMLETVLGDYDQREEMLAKMLELEHKADSFVHETMDRLNKTFVTPLDREDIHALAHVMDDVLDYTQAALDGMLLYDIDRPIPKSAEISNLLKRSTEQVRLAVQGLRNFGNIRGILDPCVKINELENQADMVNREALRSLFRDGYDAITIMKWREIYDSLETAVDRCEDVADVLETIAVKNS